jgi:hypothetical protein
MNVRRPHQESCVHGDRPGNSSTHLFVSLGAGLKPDELLVPPVGSPHISSQVVHTPIVMPGIVVGGAGSLFNSPSPPSVHQQGHGGHQKRKKSLPPSHPPSSSRASIVFPILPSNPFTAAASQKKFDADQGIGKCLVLLLVLWDVILYSTAILWCMSMSFIIQDVQITNCLQFEGQFSLIQAYFSHKSTEFFGASGAGTSDMGVEVKTFVGSSCANDLPTLTLEN